MTVILQQIVTFLISFILLPVSLFASDYEETCIADQIARVEQLEIMYESEEAEYCDEQEFCSFDIDDAYLYTYNEFQCIGTHNSYKILQPDYAYWLTSTFFDLFGEDGEAMTYEHEDLTTQLNMGVRSFEWDICEYDNLYEGYMIQHDSYVDQCSSIPNLELALEELVMWSDYNEDHMPITILIEFKDSLLPALTSGDVTTASQVVSVTDVFSEILGDKLYLPSEMVGDYSTMEEMRLADDYPTLDELQGKIIVIIHTGDACDDYDESIDFEDQVFFLSCDSVDSCFALATNPFYNSSIIYTAQEQGYLVRTLISPYLGYNDLRSEAGYSSGANILSSDYIYEYQETEYLSITRIDGEYMMSIIEDGDTTLDDDWLDWFSDTEVTEEVVY